MQATVTGKYFLKERFANFISAYFIFLFLILFFSTVITYMQSSVTEYSCAVRTQRSAHVSSADSLVLLLANAHDIRAAKWYTRNRYRKMVPVYVARVVQSGTKCFW